LPDSAYATGFIDKVPFPEMTGEEGLLARFLPDTMGKRFAHFCFRNFPGSCETELDGPWQTIHSAPLDTVLRHMMHESNNLLAEQLLLICADQRFDQLKEELVIQDMLGNSLANVNPVPRWVDGSGLSRYNLISPGGLALVLRRMWQTQPQDKLFFYFPAPGGTGTLKDWPDNSSWVGKTGSMSGVMCLSGYLKSKTGKVLIFSFMHNNFAGSNRSLKVEMQRILQLIHDLY
jgi:D-alanyl-D-alanine carboxypeptidase/D-alanyl-D-alanine-endopeptidase (penicillin-binding protein 4)